MKSIKVWEEYFHPIGSPKPFLTSGQGIELLVLTKACQLHQVFNNHQVLQSNVGSHNFVTSFILIPDLNEKFAIFKQSSFAVACI